MEALLGLSNPLLDKHTDRITWNACWESDLAHLYADDAGPGFPKPLKISPEIRQFVDSWAKQTQKALENEILLVCQLQQDVSSYALAKLACGGLDGAWKSLSDDRRKEIILEALYKTSSTGKDMEAFRRWCPEMTVSRIAEKEGQMFLELLKALITDNPAAPRTVPITFPNLLVNRLLADYNSISAATRYHLLVNRCYFISFVVWRILLALYDDDEETVVETVPIQQPKVTTTSYTLEKSRKPGDSETPQVETIEKLGENFDSDTDACRRCGKDASFLASPVTLKACVKCKEIGRIIRYCSSECQLEDWKKGIPRPHKQICGKVFVEDVERMKDVKKEKHMRAVKASALLPEPDPNFKRSHSLLYQIPQLKQYPHADYLITQPGDYPDLAVTVPDELKEMRIVFLIMRRRAMQNGDENAANMMFGILRPFVERLFPASYLAEQLQREYGVEVNLNQASVYGQGLPLYSREEGCLAMDHLGSLNQ